MGWSLGFDSQWNRDIGYGVPASCDFPGCGAKIDRGLSYVCGSEPYGGEKGCGLYFCEEHLRYRRGVHLCSRCENYRQPFTPTPDVAEWTTHKETDESWAEWRAGRDGMKPNPQCASETLATQGDNSSKPEVTAEPIVVTEKGKE